MIVNSSRPCEKKKYHSIYINVERKDIYLFYPVIDLEATPAQLNERKFTQK